MGERGVGKKPRPLGEAGSPCALGPAARAKGKKHVDREGAGPAAREMLRVGVTPPRSATLRTRDVGC